MRKWREGRKEDFSRLCWFLCWQTLPKAHVRPTNISGGGGGSQKRRDQFHSPPPPSLLTMSAGVMEHREGEKRGRGWIKDGKPGGVKNEMEFGVGDCGGS